MWCSGVLCGVVCDVQSETLSYRDRKERMAFKFDYYYTLTAVHKPKDFVQQYCFEWISTNE